MMEVLFGVVVFLIIMMSLIYFRYKTEMREMKKKLEQRSDIKELSFGSMEYKIVGQGIPVIISHGGAGGYDQGLLTAKIHLNTGFKVIALSRFGHLRTTMPSKYSAKDQADAYAELLDILGIHKAAIIGTSGGGPSAILFALRYPDRCSALILSCAVSQYLPMRNMKIYQHPFMYYLIVKYLKPLVLKQIGVDKKVYETMNQEEKTTINELIKLMNPIELRRDGLFEEVKEWAAVDKWLVDYRYADLSVPTLIIHAKNDVVVPYKHAEDIHQQVSGSKLLSLKDGGHLKLGHGALIKAETSHFIKETHNQ